MKFERTKSMTYYYCPICMLNSTNKAEIEKHDFDICLLGCGAYGFPLAAHVKRLGKKAVHIGGALQLLFGIKGRRWDREFSSIYNDAWVRPEENEKPRNANSVEGGCYW